MKQILPALLLLALSFSCREKDPINVNQERNNEIDVSELIEEFIVEEPMLHDDVRILGSDKYLYFKDYMSTDKITSVFSLPEGEYIGQFMDFGEGPHEVSMSCDINIFTSPIDQREKAIVLDLIQHRASSYDVDSALTDSLYVPRMMKPLDATTFPSHYAYINDTLGFARKITLLPETTRFQQALGKYNLRTGELTDFATEEHINDNYSLIAVSKAAERVVETGGNVDIVVIYDYDGNVLRRIKGPNYKPKAEGRRIYYSLVRVGGPYIFGVYSGGDWNTEHLGKQIVVMDLDGNYIATLDMGTRIRDLYYHEPSGILWLKFSEDERQFGKLNLAEALKKGKKIDPAANKDKKEDADKKLVSERDASDDSVIYGKVPPFYMLATNQKDTLTRFDVGNITLPRERDSIYYNPREISTYLCIGKMNDANDTTFAAFPKGTNVWFEPFKVSPDFLRSETTFKSQKFEAQPMLTLLLLGFTKDAPEGYFEGTIEVYFHGYTDPYLIPVSGTITYE